MQHVNNDPQLLPGFDLSLVAYDTSLTGRPRASTALNGALELLQRSNNIIGMLGTGYSVTVEAPSVLCSLVQKPILCPASTSPSRALVYKQEVPYLVRSVVSQEGAIGSLIAACMDFGWRHVAVLGSQGTFGRDIYGAFQEMAAEHNLTIAYYGNHPRLTRAAELDSFMSALRITYARSIVVLSDSRDVPTVVEALEQNNFLSDGYSVVLLQIRSRLAEVLAAANGQPGLLWLQPVAPSGAALKYERDITASWSSSWSTEYNASLHGAWNATTRLPLYATDGPIWEFDHNGKPNDWAKLAYDAVWLYARALDNITRRGLSPLDGVAVKEQLIATQFEGITGLVSIDPVTQDRYQDHILVNYRRDADGSLAVVEVGTLPRSPSPQSTPRTLPWLTRQIQWPGGITYDPAPGDGISVVEISVATLLGFSNRLGGLLLCAARLAESHVNARDGRVVPELSTLSSSFRVRLYPHDTNLTIAGGVAAFESALERHQADCLLGAQFSSISSAIASRARGLPQMCPLSSSDSLSNKALYPGFGRMHPTNAQAAQALTTLLRTSFWSWSAIDGSSYASGLRAAVAAHGRGMRLVASVAFEADDEASIQRAIVQLYASSISVVVCISHEADLPVLLAHAETGGLLTDAFAWIVVDVADDVVARAEAGDMTATYARHLDGLLAFQLDSRAGSLGSVAASTQLMGSTPTTGLDALAAAAAEADASLGCPSTGELPSYAPLVYDAVAALAIAVDRTDDKRRAVEVVANMRQVTMSGASGTVQMTQTGDRMLSGTSFQLRNFRHRPRRRLEGDVSALAFQAPKVLNFFPDDDGANASDSAFTFVNGSNACPCIHAFPSALPTDPSGRLVSVVDGATVYLPPAFGIGTCAVHDMAMPACQMSKRPSWCDDHWCYVDPDRCMGITSRSTYFEYAGVNLSYSHATCSRSILSVEDITWKGGVGAMPVDLSALGCPAGYEARLFENGERRCAACHSGRFKPFRAHEPCRSCLPGSYQPMTGAASCLACPMGTYQRMPEATTCDVCPQNRRPSQANGSTTCICEVGFYEDIDDDGELTCERCGIGLDCLEPGMTRNHLKLLVGYWRPSSDSLDVRRCADSVMNCGQLGACAESSTGCRGGSDHNATCAPTLDGPLCQLCAPSNVSVYYEPAWQSDWAHCTPCSDLVARTVGLVVGIVAALLLLILLTVHCARKRLSKAARERIWRLWCACKLEASLKICIGFYQIVVRIPDVYEITLTEDLRIMFTYFRWTVGLKMGSISDSM